MQIPGPDTRVVELRVHGILGTDPDDLTDSVASVDVAGDGIGRVVRPADKLLRPVSGPDLGAGERTVPRIVEGYVWSGMSAGGAKTAWALLFPFSLLNIAHWMLPPSRPESRASRALASVLRALLRLAALLLTMLLVAQFGVVAVDLLAAQCLRPGSGCLSGVPTGIRRLEWLRLWPALLVVFGLVATMHRLSAMSWRVRAPVTRRAQDSAHNPTLAGGNVVTEPDTPALRALHTSAALSTVVLLVLGGPFQPAADPRRLAALSLILVAVLGCLLLDDPSGAHERGPRRVAGMLGRLPRGLLLSGSVVLAASTLFAPVPRTGSLPGSGVVTGTLLASMSTVCVVVALLLVPAALLARPLWTRLPRELRPWAGGWMAAPVLLISCLLGAGFGTGLALAVRGAVGSVGGVTLVLPDSYRTVALLWGTASVLLAAAVVPVALWVVLRWLRVGRTGAVGPEVALLHAGRPEDQHRAARAWRNAGLQRGFAHYPVFVLAGALLIGACVSIVTGRMGWFALRWTDWLSALGVAALATLAAGLVRAVYVAVRRPRVARRFRVFCDLAFFWPREAHPVVPPCYALKVVPELVARATEHLAEPDTRVVLTGHSQGSLLATVAAARLLESLPADARERVGLVTAGSQLQWAYSRAFPGVVPHATQRRLFGDFGGRWRSLCRGTDPLGGAVTTWNRQVFGGMLLGVGFRADGSEGPLPPATRGPTGALVLGGDHWLPDPQRGPSGIRRWLPGVLGHSEYSGDPEWDRAVAMAAGLESPVRATGLPLHTAAAPQAANPAFTGPVSGGTADDGEASAFLPRTPHEATTFEGHGPRNRVGTHPELTRNDGDAAVHAAARAPVPAEETSSRETGDGTAGAMRCLPRTEQPPAGSAAAIPAPAGATPSRTVSTEPPPAGSGGVADSAEDTGAATGPDHGAGGAHGDRTDRLEPPEIIEPPGSTPPWERGGVLPRSDH